ncbi:lactoperoxidase-like [Patiria miniata]|uniref:Peroxidase n=1 Tax=Patiria miniata TaxID=46514 RepID=A0A914ASI1_PATMI|nr:lactoperoxidase-like [Patiria miniata]
MIRLLLIVLLASSVCCTLLNEDLKSLEDLEDLLLRDENTATYSNDRNPDVLLSDFNSKRSTDDENKDRTPDVLLGQFNSRKRSPVNKRKLEMYLRKLEDSEGAFRQLLSAGELEKRILQIREILGEEETCDTTPYGYRTIDGTCNNVAKSTQGSAGTAQKRIPEINAYDDGLSEPRTLSVSGGPLPNARDVSRTVFNTHRRMVRDFTQMGMNIGQLADHDVSASHSPQVDCSDCSEEGECFPIMIDESDPVFGGKQPCFNIRRSKYEVDSMGVRQQTNFITSYLDASFVYGSDDALAAELKDESGSMKHLTDKMTGRELLPPDKDLKGCAGVDEAAGIWCGKAGDHRAAEQPGITALQTLFLREHNRIAEELRRLDPLLPAEEVYQKARKILGAKWQHIIFNEYLPLIIGEELYTSKNLSPNAPYEYDPDVDASVSNLFAAAAFRFGHTQVPFHYVRATKNYMRKLPRIPMSEAFFNASFMFDESIPDGAVDSILRGMTVQSMYNVDRRFSDALVNNLFGDPEVEGDGFDLVSIDIQRGRDHGLPSYTTIRKDFCGLGEINSFQDLIDDGVMPWDDLRGLQKAYSDVKDVDAFVGSVLETHLPNTLVGPFLACIFADQFHRIKFGDRFFYENSEQFTPDQIQEIKKATAARLMCDNVEGLRKIQPFIFIKSNNYQAGQVDLEEVYARQHGDSSEAKRGLYDSFYEYSRSGTWPHKRAVVLDGLDNSRVFCDSDQIPVVDLSKFV